jgi:preprotein translocase subunit SecY
MEMFKTIAKAWKIDDIRKKIIYTLLMLVIFRIGSNIPVPGINRAYLDQAINNQEGLFALFDLFSGGAFSNFTIFALSITPYITASIILQLLTIAIPALERLAREGQEGQKKIAQYTRYLTVVLATVQAAGLTFGLFRNYLLSDSIAMKGVIILTLVAGTAFLMWLGERINENGIGNGISLIIFAGIVSRLPVAIRGTIASLKDDTVTITLGAQQNTVVIARWAIRSVEDAPLENDSEALV